MDLEILTQADMVLSKCGRPEAPRGDLSAVYIPRFILVQTNFDVGTGQTNQTITKEIVGDTPWCLRDMQIAATTATAIYLQILKPDGRFLFNNPIDLLQINGYGSFRYAWSKELKCPPGSKIEVTVVNTNTAVAQPVSILFGGAYLYYVKATGPRVCPNEELVSFLPRYFGNHANENIMAPCWQQGVGPKTPQGFRDEEFTYGGQNSPVLVSVTAANPQATQQIQIDSDCEFHVRRILPEIGADNTVTSGIFVVRLRDGSGFALTDDYLDVAAYIGGAPMPKDWVINPGDSAYADIIATDVSGTGNLKFRFFLEGFKRRRAA